MSINSKDISDLRERTGAGIVDCKKALTESNGDLNKAMEILRQKGLASAAKKTGKVAAEGAVIARTKPDQKKGIILELNSQTDFVAKNQKFQDLLEEVIAIALNQNINTLNDLKAAKNDKGENLSDIISLKTAEIGEKLDLRRFEAYVAEASDESIAQYTHPVGSRIATLVKVKGGDENFGREIAMHISAMQPAPEFLNRDAISEEVIENEKRIESGKADLANKPKDIVDKIVSGRVDKVLMEKVLLEQPFIKNPNQKIKEFALENKAEIIQFIRFNLGEGIEKNESNFAEEVAAQMKK